MSLLSTCQIHAIEAFFVDDALVDHRRVEVTGVDLSAADLSAVELTAVDVTAAELSVVGERLTISDLSTLDLPAGWLSESVDPSADAIGIVLPVDTQGHLGAIVDRAGSATWFSIEDGRLRLDGAASCRLLDDLARSRLGLPTALPAAGTDWFWLGRWLLGAQQAIVATEPHRGGRSLDAVFVAGRHPAIDADDLFGLDFEHLTSFVIDRHRDHAVVADWECVRLDARDNAHHRFHHLSSVFDEGAFSRWVTACDLPLSALAEPLMLGCSPLALRLVGAVIADVVLRQRVA